MHSIPETDVGTDFSAVIIRPLKGAVQHSTATETVVLYKIYYLIIMYTLYVCVWETLSVSNPSRKVIKDPLDDDGLQDGLYKYYVRAYYYLLL